MEKLTDKSIISVEGNGIVEAEANILEMIITVYKITDSIKQSQNEVNNIVYGIINILRKYNMNENNIHTSSIKFDPNYTWEDNRIKYTGQKVEQILICFVENIKDNINMIVNILDEITIDNNSIKLSLSFGVKENRNMILECREKAYNDGFEKAKRYADMAGLKIIKTLRISEGNEYSSHSDRKIRIGDFSGYNSGGSHTQLPMGKVEKSMTLSIDFIAE